MDHGYADVNGVRLHYVSEGKGPLIVFAHGFPEFWYAWRTQLHEFGRDHQAVAPDLRGYNLSDKPAAVEAYRVKPLVADVLALAARYTQEKFVLVAHDWGGAVAWSVAISHPERLSRLVMLNSPHPYVFWRELCASPAQRAASAYMTLFRLAKAERVLSANGYARLLAWFPGLDPDYRRELLAAWSQPGALSGGLNYYRASPLYPPTADDPGPLKLELKPGDFVVRVPTLVLWGERDPALLTGCLDGLEALVPDLKLVRVPEATHWIARERTERVIAEIEAFTIGR